MTHTGRSAAVTAAIDCWSAIRSAELLETQPAQLNPTSTVAMPPTVAPMMAGPSHFTILISALLACGEGKIPSPNLA